MGTAFPSFLGKSTGTELLNWQVSGTVLLQGRADLVMAWAAANDYTKPQYPLPGIDLVDAETLFYVNARGDLVASAADVFVLDCGFDDLKVLKRPQRLKVDFVIRARHVERRTR